MEIALWYEKVATKNDETSKWAVSICVNTFYPSHIFFITTLPMYG